MTAGTYHFTIEQGSTFTRVITYKDASGSLVNLSAHTALMHLRKKVDDSSTILELSTANGRITLGGVAGTVTITISASDTANLDAVEGVYDLELINGDVIEKLLAGTFTVKKEVTR